MARGEDVRGLFHAPEAFLGVDRAHLTGVLVFGGAAASGYPFRRCTGQQPENPRQRGGDWSTRESCGCIGAPLFSRWQYNRLRVLGLRAPWPNSFPPVVIHTLWADGSQPPRPHLKRHPAYHAAKYHGDLEAALQVVVDLHDAHAIRRLRRLGGLDAIVLSPRPRLDDRLNMIPLAFEQLVADSMGWHVEERVMQSHVLGRTGRGNWARLIAQPVFEGEVERNGRYVILDDVLTLGT